MPAFRFTPSERAIFKRLPAMKVSEWAARHLIVPDGPFAGSLWRRDVSPYSVGIMDAWGEPWVEEVRIAGAPQVGKTILMYACLGYGVDRRPGPRMLTMPNDPAITKMLEAKLRPMFRRTAVLRKRLRKIKTSGAVAMHFRDSTILHLASAESQSQRASVSIMDMFIDEEDLYSQRAGAGLPIVDILERQRFYQHKRKTLRVSKPIGGEDSSIYQAVQGADEIRRYEVRCPACGGYQHMVEDGLVSSVAGADSRRIRREHLARYRCAHCQYLWTDHMRDMAVAAGRWRAEAPVARPRCIGFELPAILARVVSLSEVLEAKLTAEASDDPDAKQAYDNGYWARPYKPVVEETDEQRILSLRDDTLPPRVIPPGFIALTAGIDMQTRGFWFMVCAWTAALECFVLDYGRLMTFDDVQALVWDTPYPQAAGGQALPIWRSLLDTGGSKSDVDMLTRTEEAYQFIRMHGGPRIFAAKGASHQQTIPVTWSVIDKMPHTRAAIPGGLQLFKLDTHYFKALAHARMKPTAKQPIVLHAEAEESLAAQLSAERLVRGRGGSTAWEAIRKDNHYFDCLCLNFACAHASWTPSLQYLAQRALAEQQTPPTPPAAQPPAPQINPYTKQEARP